MKTAIYAGSFDPITNGHLWMIREGSHLFDKLIVAVSNNADKKYTLDFQTRLRLVKESLAAEQDLDNVEVVPVENDFIVTLAKNQNVDYLLRGIRSNLDYEYESQISRINSDLSHGRYLQSLFLMPSMEVGHISSSMVKGLIGFKGWEQAAGKYIPAPVSTELIYRFSNQLNQRCGILLRKYGFKFTYLDLFDAYEGDPANPSKRPYHSLRHIQECIEQFGRIRNSFEMPDLVELALYFHDVIYQAGADNNESQSADFFMKQAAESSMTDEQKEMVKKIIITTDWLEQQDQLVNGDLHLLHDVDFSIFAADWERFLEYDEGIEKEYAHVPKEVFHKHRKDFLVKLRDMGTFYTHLFDDQKAKNNIDKLLALKYSVTS